MGTKICILFIPKGVANVLSPLAFLLEARMQRGTFSHVDWKTAMCKKILQSILDLVFIKSTNFSSLLTIFFYIEQSKCGQE